uniref:SEA domain-containing protein n=1 Tax=Heterorhabditis bacteriophora TaxID=37862 RepID=A0A1I7XU05_HETBA
MRVLVQSTPDFEVSPKTCNTIKSNIAYSTLCSTMSTNEGIFITIMWFRLMVLTGLLAIADGCASSAEKRIQFEVSGFTVPLAFAYAANSSVASSQPRIQLSSNAATNKIRQFVMDAVNKVLRDMAASNGFSHLIDQLASQLEVMITYNPILCESLHNFDSTMWSDITSNSALGFHCIVTGGDVTSSCNKTPTDTCAVNGVKTPIPETYKKFSAVLVVTTCYLSFYPSRLLYSNCTTPKSGF